MKSTLNIFGFLAFFLSPFSSFSQCPAGETELTITFVISGSSTGFGWEIFGNGGSPVYASGGNYLDNSTNTEQVCLQNDQYLIFSIDNPNLNALAPGYVQLSMPGHVLEFVEDLTTFNHTFVFNVTPPEANMVEVILPNYPTQQEQEVKAKLTNLGTYDITEVEAHWQQPGNGVRIQTFSFTSSPIAPGDTATIVFDEKWEPSAGNQTMNVKIREINNDANWTPAVQEVGKSVVVSPSIPNRIQEYVDSLVTFTTVATGQWGLDNPVDLAWHSELGRDELWILNQRDSTIGGATVTYISPEEDNLSPEWREDDFALDYMQVPTAMAFNENGEWASTSGVKDVNQMGGTFAGPTVWSGNLDVHGDASNGEGSHLDDLQDNPYAMGVAYERENVFWVYDGWHGHIVRNDFSALHGVGGNYHEDARVSRYTSLGLDSGVHEIPCHMAMAEDRQTLYYVDNPNGKLMRFDTHSGIEMGPYPMINENLASNFQIGFVTPEVLADSGLVSPTGLALNNKFALVTDDANGDIIIYNLDSVPGQMEVARLHTGTAGIRGLEIGPEGKIWYVTGEDNRLMRVDFVATGLDELATENNDFTLFPNPGNGMVHLNLPTNFKGGQLEVLDASGKLVFEENLTAVSQYNFQTENLAAGVYVIRLKTASAIGAKRLVVK